MRITHRIAAIVLMWGASGTHTPAWTQESDPPLRGLASLSGIAATAVRAPACLPGCKRDMGVQCVQVHVQNNTDQPITVNGNDASGAISGTNFQSVTDKTVQSKSGCGLSGKDVALLAVVGVGTVGLGQDLLFDIMTTPKTLGEPFFRDGIRQKIEAVKFGRRLLMPGDETTGWLCFSSSIAPDTVSLPVAGMDGKQAGELKLTVAATVAPMPANVVPTKLKPARTERAAGPW